MTVSNLLQAADQAFAAGRNQLGLKRLREHCANNTADAGSCNRLAVVEEQIGDWNLAGQAHYQCIESAPHIAASYLYAGYWLQQSNNIDAAVAAYSLAQECDPLILSTQAKQSDFARTRALAGKQLLCQYLSEQHRQLFGSESATTRIKDAIWPQTHDQDFEYQSREFAPDLFYIEQLRQQPYYATDEFSWSVDLHKHCELISTELKNALAEKSTIEYLRPYLAKHSVKQGPLQKLAGSLEWSALDLYKAGAQNQQIAALFPKTLELLEAVPAYSLDEQPYEVFFSLLKPGQEIAPHYGQSNHSLTAHLALEVPANCHLIVAGQRCKWQQGKLMVFDDSFLHSAHNLSDQLRVVLIFSVWHPDLSDAEKKAIQLSFKTRLTWMQQRRAKLDELVTPPSSYK